MATTKKRGKAAPEEPATNPPPGEGRPVPEPSVNGEAQREPARVLSYPVARDTQVQATVWERLVTLPDGAEFLAHDVSISKRYKTAEGEWKTTHSFRGSELYALAHAVSQAAAFVLEAR